MNEKIENNNQKTDTNNLKLASFSSRFKAFIIDDFLITLVLIALYWDIVSVSNSIEDILAVMNEVFYQALLIKFCYQGFFIWYYGATIGKIIAKIRVIDYYSFGRVSLLTSFIRSIFRILGEMFFYIGFMFAFFGDAKQTLQDRVAKTLVVDA